MPRLKENAKSEKISPRQEIERRILHGVACEWEAAIDNLAPAVSKLIRRPLFSIRDLKGQWGNWSPVKQEIALSRNLVMNYPWDSIRDVLLHETAHQIAQQIREGATESAHGPAFKAACAILGIDPVASADYVPLQDRLLGDAPSEQDRRMLRIKKLLALAESKNRHEAEAAMLKAHELIAKYNLDHLDRGAVEDLISVFVGKPALRHPKEAYFLANLIQDFYFVRGLWICAYVGEKEKMGRVLEISGSIENVKLASYVNDFVCNYIDSQWSLYNNAGEFNRFRKSDFAVGVIEGFRSKLTSEAHRPHKIKTRLAVIRRTDSLLAQYFCYRYPHTVSIRRKLPHQNQTIVEDGRKIGKKLVINKGIRKHHCGRVRLIGQ
jgi:hypothetical protein